MIDWNQLLSAHPAIAKWLLILFVISEGLALIPKSILQADSIIQLIMNLRKKKPSGDSSNAD